jgi:nitrate reductase NapE component
MASKLLPHNEGKVDRIVRVVIGIALLPLLAVGPVPGWGLVGLLGVVALLTGLVGSCPLYTLFGLSTCPLPKTTER